MSERDPWAAAAVDTLYDALKYDSTMLNIFAVFLERADAQAFKAQLLGFISERYGPGELTDTAEWMRRRAGPPSYWPPLETLK